MKKKKTLKIGITGGIGAGKSIISRIFSLLGIPVYNADDQAKYLMNHDKILKREIIDHLGEKSYKDGRLNRAYLSAKIFDNEDYQQKINSLVHPRVREDFYHWHQAHMTSSYTLKEAALLYESGSYKELDKIIMIYSPTDLRVERVLLRDHFRTGEEVMKIIAKQMPDEEKRKMADYVIYNDDKRLVIPQVIDFHNKILEMIREE